MKDGASKAVDSKRVHPRRSLHRMVSCFHGGLDDLVFWSFRYFLGRMTIHTGVFADDLVRAWPLLNEHVRSLIQRDLEEAFRSDDAHRASGSPCRHLGADCDREMWARVRACYAANDRTDAQPTP